MLGKLLSFRFFCWFFRLLMEILTVTWLRQIDLKLLLLKTAGKYEYNSNYSIHWEKRQVFTCKNQTKPLSHSHNSKITTVHVFCQSISHIHTQLRFQNLLMLTEYIIASVGLNALHHASNFVNRPRYFCALHITSHHDRNSIFLYIQSARGIFYYARFMATRGIIQFVRRCTYLAI